jgi:short subunit dehydrogenase-like uncharacterized protein
MADTFLIYGSYGYSGNLIAEEAVRQGMQPILAGRDAASLTTQAEHLGLQSRAFSLDDHSSLQAALDTVPLVLNCAGPFIHTYQAMVAACLRTHTHYMDITGEIAVFEALARLDDQARHERIMLLPGMGMDVVPSDCLALHLKQRLPDANQLSLAILALGAGVSPGTALTSIEGIGKGGVVRRDGRLALIPMGSKKRSFDFGRGPLEMVSVPWGDISTAYYSTGIPNIEVYMYFPRFMRTMMAFSRHAGGLLSSKPVQLLLKAVIKSLLHGPSADARRTGRSYFLGEVCAEDGSYAVARLQTPEGYALTALTAVEGARRVLSGNFLPGFHTPAMAFGEDFILTFEGVKREDLISGQVAE